MVVFVKFIHLFYFILFYFFFGSSGIEKIHALNLALLFDFFGAILNELNQGFSRNEENLTKLKQITFPSIKLICDWLTSNPTMLSLYPKIDLLFHENSDLDPFHYEVS